MTDLDPVDAPTPAHAYQSYYGPAIFEPLSEQVIGVAGAAPDPGARVLDVASGTGILTRRLAQIVGAEGSITGVDLNPGMVAVAEELGSRPGWAPIDYRQGDAAALDLGDDTFDHLTCQQGLQFVPDRAGACAELARVLRPGGRAVVAVWRGIDHHPLYGALADAEEPRLAEYGLEIPRAELEAPFSLGDIEELEALLHDAGFASVEVSDASIDARFADADRFVERLEFAYAAVVPAFAEDPDLFATYLAAVTTDTKAVVDRYRRGDEVVVPMHTRIAVATFR